MYSILVKTSRRGTTDQGDDIIMLQRRKYLLPLPWFYVWKDWKCLNDPIHEKELLLVKLVKQVEQVLNDIDSIKKTLKAESAELGNHYESRPLNFKTDEWFFKKHEPLSPVPRKDWEYAIHPKLLNKVFSSVQTTREKVGAEERHVVKSAGFLHPDVQNHKIHMDVSSEMPMIPYRPPDSGNEGNKKDRKRRPGESDQDYQARMREMNKQQKGNNQNTTS